MEKMLRAVGLLLAVALALATPASAATIPALQLQHVRPMIVRGVGFHARESVSVTAPSGHIRTKTNAAGSFVVTFQSGGDRCSGGRIVAIGARGEHAVLRLPPTMCLPATTP
jgi:hypothetical protein